MKVYPWKEVIATVEERIHAAPNTYAFQQFNCAHCGIKQTVDKPNSFSKLARCEECGGVTNCEKRGINYMLVMGRIGPDAVAALDGLIAESDVGGEHKKR